MDLPHKQSCWKHVSKIKQGLLPYKPSHQGWFWPCAVPYISNSVLPFGWDQNKASHPLNKHYCEACYSGKRVKSAWLFLPTPCVTVVRPARAANYCHLKDWVSTALDEEELAVAALCTCSSFAMSLASTRSRWLKVLVPRLTKFCSTAGFWNKRVT